MQTPTRPGTRTHARTHTHAQKYLILIDFTRQQWFANAPQCYVIRTLPVLLSSNITNGIRLVVTFSRCNLPYGEASIQYSLLYRVIFNVDLDTSERDSPPSLNSNCCRLLVTKSRVNARLCNLLQRGRSQLWLCSSDVRRRFRVYIGTLFMS